MCQLICGWFAGRAVVPGLDLIATLPLVRHMVVSPEVWQSGNASAIGAETTAATPILAIAIDIAIANVPRPVIVSPPFGPLPGYANGDAATPDSPIRGRPR